MKDIKIIWDSLFIMPKENENNEPFSILMQQIKAINQEIMVNAVLAFIVDIVDEANNEIKHIVYLSPVNGSNFKYPFIELIQPIDTYYPVKIQAFQTNKTLFGTIEESAGPAAIYEVLDKIFSDYRTRIVFNHLKSVSL